MTDLCNIWSVDIINSFFLKYIICFLWIVYTILLLSLLLNIITVWCFVFFTTGDLIVMFYWSLIKKKRLPTFFSKSCCNLLNLLNARGLYRTKYKNSCSLKVINFFLVSHFWLANPLFSYSTSTSTALLPDRLYWWPNYSSCSSEMLCSVIFQEV